MTNDCDHDGPTWFQRHYWIALPAGVNVPLAISLLLLPWFPVLIFVTAGAASMIVILSVATCTRRRPRRVYRWTMIGCVHALVLLWCAAILSGNGLLLYHAIWTTAVAAILAGYWNLLGRPRRAYLLRDGRRIPLALRVFTCDDCDSPHWAAFSAGAPFEIVGQLEFRCDHNPDKCTIAVMVGQGPLGSGVCPSVTAIDGVPTAIWVDELTPLYPE